MLPEEKVFQKKKLQMLNQYDAITKKFHHLVPYHDFDPEEVEIKILQEYALHNERLFPEVSDSEKKSLSARNQEFLYFCSKKDLPMTGKNTHSHSCTQSHNHTICAHTYAREKCLLLLVLCFQEYQVTVIV